MEPTHVPQTPDRRTWRAAAQLALLFAACKLLLQFALTLWGQHLGYGYFRDEFYYIACGRHLAWGYVDHGPMVAVQARVGEALFGDSLFAIRLLSACAGAIAVFLCGLITCALGGGRTAQALAMLALLLTPEYIGIDSFLSMNSFEPVFWMLCVLCLLLIQRGHRPSLWWTVFGASAGIGLLNKPSMLFFLIALGVGLLLTPARRLLFSRWCAVAILLAFFIALPNVVWQIHNHWPTLEFLRNGKLHHKNVVLGPLAFLAAQVMMLAPLNMLLWITGLVSLLRARTFRDGRWLGLTYIVFFLLMFAAHAKDYYLAPIYPALYAAGGLAWEARFSRPATASSRGRAWPIPALAAVLVITGLLVVPLAAPVLQPDTWVRYATGLHLHDGGSKTETMATSELPQFFADRFGWDELTTEVVAAYRSLPATDRAHVCLFADNYGEAGAMDFLARRLEPALPPAISGHNSYWLWGPHACDGQLVIAYTDDSLAHLQTEYKSVTALGGISNRLAMPFEREKKLYLLRGLQAGSPFDPVTGWPKQKFYI